MTEPRAVRIPSHRGELHLMDTATYEEIKDALGGAWLEAAPTDGTVTLYIDTDGKAKMLPINLLATAFWTHVGGAECVLRGDFLVGPVVVCGPPDPEGDDTAVPAAVVDVLTALSLMAMEAPE
jgi:hypothetical protein